MDVLPLHASSVRLRWLSSEPEDPAHVERWRELLDADERARAQRFHFATDRHAFIAAHALLRSMLSDATGLSTSAWRFVAGPHGRPELAPPFTELGLRFNISHTRGWVACAIARAAVGVDVEAVDRDAAHEVLDVFSAGEVRLLKARPRDQLALTFTRLWTLKEAFIKATGEGLARPLDSFSFELDPVRIAFHPERHRAATDDDPDRWEFAELAPAPARRLALAVRRRGARAPDLKDVDARSARPEEVSWRRGSNN